MSTPNPTHIIKEHQPRQLWPGRPKLVCRNPDCYSCDWSPEHVVSKLTDAGYSIVPSGWRPPAHVYNDAADVPVRTVIWWPADKTVAARFDKTNGVVLGDDRPFPWSVITGPVTVLFQEDAAAAEGGEAVSRYPLGTRVRKTKGASWQGIVVGHYSTTLTVDGVCVESEREPGSVQLYPVAALETVTDATDTEPCGYNPAGIPCTLPKGHL